MPQVADRESLRLLWRGPKFDQECRAEIDPTDGGLIVWWFEQDDRGKWYYDQGARVPKEGLERLTTFLLDQL